MLFKSAAILGLAGLAAAAPSPAIMKRNNGGSGGYTDADIINYALTLEHLEAAFYREGLKMYNAGAFKDSSL